MRTRRRWRCCRRRLRSGTVEQLKTFASETAPVVEDHLEQARQLP
jgi:hypothetical protein